MDSRSRRWTLEGLVVLVLLLSALATLPHVVGDGGMLHAHLDQTCLACVVAAHPAVVPEAATGIEPLRCCRLIRTAPAPATDGQEASLPYLSRAPPADPRAHAA